MFLRLLALYLVLVNAFVFFLFWLDKRRARKGQRRISEKELLMWSALGGWPGALMAMRKFRHKTKKRSFRAWLYGLIALQFAVAAYLVLR